MPIVNVQMVGAEVERVRSAVVQELADCLGVLFESGPGTTWVRMSYLAREDYAENHAELDPSVQPVFVEVLRRALPPTAELAAEADRVAEAVAAVLERPKENTHVLYLPPGELRMAFGGKLIGG